MSRPAQHLFTLRPPRVLPCPTPLHSETPTCPALPYRIEPKSETLVNHLGEELAPLDTKGYFGETVLFGLRRATTHVARTRCNTLNISRDALDTIFTEQPEVANAMIKMVSHDMLRKQRLYNMMMKSAVWLMRPNDSKTAAALAIQLVFRRTEQRKHRVQHAQPAHIAGTHSRVAQPAQ